MDYNKFIHRMQAQKEEATEEKKTESKEAQE